MVLPIMVCLMHQRYSSSVSPFQAKTGMPSAAKATAAGNAKKAQEAMDSAVARKVWLAEAEKNLAEFI
jgi:hypothetical protein